MIKGRRAREVPGSLQRDRLERRGASVTGVCQCASRACSMWCRVSAPCTDRRSSEQLARTLVIPRPRIKVHHHCHAISISQQHTGAAMKYRSSKR